MVVNMSRPSSGRGSASNERYIRKLGARSQVTIPKDIVDYLQLKEGDQVSMVREKGQIIIEPVKIVPRDALYYEVGSDDQYITAEDLKQAATEAISDYQAGKLKQYKNAEELFKTNDWVVEEE
jgi:AbrB family looped-hinge helix DNA binding protein